MNEKIEQDVDIIDYLKTEKGDLLEMKRSLSEQNYKMTDGYNRLAEEKRHHEEESRMKQKIIESL